MWLFVTFPSMAKKLSSMWLLDDTHIMWRLGPKMCWLCSTSRLSSTHSASWWPTVSLNFNNLIGRLDVPHFVEQREVTGDLACMVNNKNLFKNQYKKWVCYCIVYIYVNVRDTGAKNAFNARVIWSSCKCYHLNINNQADTRVVIISKKFQTDP